MRYSHGELVQLAEEGRRKKMPRYIDAAPYEDGRIVLNKEDDGVPVAEIPTADVLPAKRGRWIKNDFYEDALMCSCCRAYLGREDWSSHNFYFCYHCGAFMEGMDRGPDMRGGGGNVE